LADRRFTHVLGLAAAAGLLALATACGGDPPPTITPVAPVRVAPTATPARPTALPAEIPTQGGAPLPAVQTGVPAIQTGVPAIQTGVPGLTPRR